MKKWKEKQDDAVAAVDNPHEGQQDKESEDPGNNLPATMLNIVDDIESAATTMNLLDDFDFSFLNNGTVLVNMKGKKKLDQNYLLFDNESTHHIFSNAKYLSNI